jgi:hypothetical protein
MATIQIDRSSSLCLACNRGARPSEDGHITIAEYSERSGEPGCGEPWTAVRINYLPFIGGFVFENLRGLPLEGFLIELGTTYPPTVQTPA